MPQFDLDEVQVNAEGAEADSAAHSDMTVQELHSHHVFVDWQRQAEVCDGTCLTCRLQPHHWIVAAPGM